ncbi:MAG TPA: hypothetical protein VEL71_06360 [Candidatus Dormibacteraeota bacterium]|nr:hypothetical protein [Candidatus Dormibacteraeota bacterium]
MLLTSPRFEPPILWKCKSTLGPDGGYVVDWSGSPTFRVTFGAIGQDYSELHMVPVLTGVGIAVPAGSWLLERVSCLDSLNCYVIDPKEVAVKYQVISSKLSADDVIVVRVH